MLKPQVAVREPPETLTAYAHGLLTQVSGLDAVAPATANIGSIGAIPVLVLGLSHLWTLRPALLVDRSKHLLTAIMPILFGGEANGGRSWVAQSSLPSVPPFRGLRP